MLISCWTHLSHIVRSLHKNHQQRASVLSKGFLVVLLRSWVSGRDHEGHPGIGKGRHPNLRRGRSVGVVVIKNASGHHADPLFEMTQ